MAHKLLRSVQISDLGMDLIRVLLPSLFPLLVLRRIKMSLLPEVFLVSPTFTKPSPSPPFPTFQTTNSSSSLTFYFPPLLVVSCQFTWLLFRFVLSVVVGLTSRTFIFLLAPHPMGDFYPCLFFLSLPIQDESFRTSFWFFGPTRFLQKCGG